jgi:probable F420-dependent oxidoreductase
MKMSVGLSVYYNVDANDAVQLAVAAEELGFDAIWFGEHPFSIEYTSERATGYSTHHHVGGRHKGSVVDTSVSHLLDPWVALGAMSSVTTRLRLATGVIALPLRHPLMVAHHAASLHAFSNGRFMLGVGSGWMREEFDAMDMPFESRGERTDEGLEILRLAQSGQPFAFHGKHFDFKELQVSPAATPYPLVIGGNSKRALRRAAEHGDAWFTSGTPSLDEAVALRDGLQSQRDKLGRDGELRCYFRALELDERIIESYAREGLPDLVVWADKVWPAHEDLEGKRKALAAAARRFGIA